MKITKWLFLTLNGTRCSLGMYESSMSFSLALNLLLSAFPLNCISSLLPQTLGRLLSGDRNLHKRFAKSQIFCSSLRRVFVPLR